MSASCVIKEQKTCLAVVKLIPIYREHHNEADISHNQMWQDHRLYKNKNNNLTLRVIFKLPYLIECHFNRDIQ